MKINKYPDRFCKKCKRYPCVDMTNLKCDFAQYGCIYYKS